jgi:hypothetical protein
MNLKDTNQLEKEMSAMDTFYSEEIRNEYNSAMFFIEWINDRSNHPTSGDAYSLNKKDGKIVIGNLFDENFEEIAVDKNDFINLLSLNWN